MQLLRLKILILCDVIVLMEFTQLEDTSHLTNEAFRAKSWTYAVVCCTYCALCIMQKLLKSKKIA
jgi:hypothetical protein